VASLPDLDQLAAEAERLLDVAQRTLDIDAIEGAIERLSELEAQLRPSVNPSVSGNLASMRLARFEMLGRDAQGDLEDAIAALSMLLEREPAGPPSRVYRMGALARGLRMRYDAGGPLADLDRAQDLLRCMLRLEIPDEVRGDVLNDLGGILRQLWEREGNEAYLAEARALLQESAAMAGDPLRLGAAHNRLGLLEFRTYQLTQRRAFLDAALAQFERSVDAYPWDAPGRGEPLNNLAETLRLTGQLEPGSSGEHVTRAIAILRELIATPGMPALWQAERRHNLAVMLLERAELEDLQAAWALLEEALEEPLVRGSSRAAFRLTEAKIERRLLEETGDGAHAERAVAALEEAAASDADLYIALTAARQLGDLHHARGAIAASAAAFSRAVDLASAWYRGLAARATKEAWLTSVNQLPQSAAVTLAASGDPDGAVKALEETRTLILSERIERRSIQLDRLREEGHGDLADRLTKAAADLEAARGESGAEISAESGLDAIVGEVRSIAGFERFLMRRPLQDLHPLAARRPVVYLVAGRYGGCALVVDGSQTRGVPLPAFDDGDGPLWDEMERYFSRYDRRSTMPREWMAAMDRLCEWMGEAVMEPMLAALPSDSCTLIPTGILSVLPWHAARLGDCSYVLDATSVAYAPSGQALLASRHPDGASERLVAIVEPAAAGVRPLPGAAPEVAAISRHFTGVGRLADAEATVAAVQDALPRAACVHFACHGVARPNDPTQSFVLMADGPLTVAAIAGRAGGLAATDLVVLSACETALTGLSTPDEAVNLPSAFLEQGAGSAIGSLWVAPDIATALLMVRLYWGWRTGGLLLPEALQDAQRWLRAATNREIVAWLRESAPDNPGHLELAAQREHKPPEVMPFAHPVYWGAFVYIGRC
jgi:CHAT domain-containing protein/tetratricopeptide (TPR) repeat protein